MVLSVGSGNPNITNCGRNTRFGHGLDAVECARKSNEAQRRKKSALALVTAMLDSKVSEKDSARIKKEFGLDEEEEITHLAKMIAGQAKAAELGNSKSFKALMDIVRENEEKEAKREAERIAMLNRTYHMDLDIIADNFHSLIRDVRNEKHREYVLKGGRGSNKSSVIANTIIELIKNNHDVHALVCRKVGKTLKDSVYNKIKWAVNKQGLKDEFEFHKSPLEITYKPTGQKIYFRGADEPDKIKSISPEFGYIGIVWFEELDQYSGDKEVRSIIQSAIRGGDKAWIFKSYNPPRNSNSWVNRWVLLPKSNMLVHHSTYHDVPEEWLGEPFIEEAEHLKEVNPTAYEHEYGGQSVGSGTEVFDNLEIREITDEEIAGFDRIYRGVDWGWSPDPYQYIQCHYDANRAIIYVYEDFRANKMSNEDTANAIIDKYDLTMNDVVTCDSAEKKSIADYRAYGVNARPAEKGPDSVRYGMKWLQSRVKIVIDPARCPNAAKEFSEYEYELTKDGEPTGSYPDKNNHTIDALRYALNSFWKRKGN